MRHATSSRFNMNELWTARALRVDSRAITRGDIVQPLTGTCEFPRYFSRAAGAHIWDVDGNRYIDYLLGYGPVILGHSHPVVGSAVVGELKRGNCVAPLWSTRQVELTELLSEVIPGAEQSLLLKTGSDATSAAVRLARIFTGREMVLRSGYNGWHDWSAERADGIPEAVRANTTVFDYLDLGALERELTAHPYACIVMMPFEDEETTPEHLTAIRNLAHSRGTLLVLDELRSGFRVSLGGAQEFLDVQADLVALGKAMGNGFAISALTGRAEILEGLARTKISSTHFANPVDMVAAITTISVLRESDALDRIWSAGALLQDGLRSLVADSGLPAEVVGYPPMPFLRFAFDDPHVQSRATHLFFAATTQRGLLLHPEHQWFVSAAHTTADIEQTLDTCGSALALTASEVG